MTETTHKINVHVEELELDKVNIDSDDTVDECAPESVDVDADVERERVPTSGTEAMAALQEKNHTCIDGSAHDEKMSCTVLSYITLDEDHLCLLMQLWLLALLSMTWGIFLS